MPKPKPSDLTIEKLKASVHYNDKTGVFTRVAKGRGYTNKPVGSTYKDGYTRVGVNYRIYMANRLAWFYMTGVWPKELVDHKDLDKSNNCWDNLREASYTENNYNVGIISTNTSTYKGVSQAKNNSNRWRATISHNNKTIHIGTYDTKEQAYEAYCQKAVELRGTEFTRLS